MFSEALGSFCFMGVPSNSSIFVSDKDLNGNMDPSEFGLLLRPSAEIHKEECQTSTPEDHNLIRPKSPSVQERDKEEDRKQCNVILSSVPVTPLKNLKLEIPSYEVLEKEDDSNEGFKTPTSLDHKIKNLECPGAPRKTKSRPAKKRKACDQQQVMPDLCQELESLFPTPVVVDHGAGGKIKRVKQCSVAG